MCNNNNFSFITKTIAFIGQRSMSIMLFHMPAFSFATIVFHKFCGLKLPANQSNSYTDIPYNIITGIIGIILPIFIVEFLLIIKKLLINKCLSKNILKTRLLK